MTKRERTLLSLMGGMGLLVIGLIGMTKFKSHMEALRSERDQLASKSAACETSQKIYEVLESQREWINDNEPTKESYINAQQDLRSLVDREISVQGVTGAEVVTDSQEDTGGVYRVLRVLATATLTQQQMLLWISKVHSPKDFRAVRSLELKNSSKEGMVQCRFIVEQLIITKGE